MDWQHRCWLCVSLAAVARLHGNTTSCLSQLPTALHVSHLLHSVLIMPFTKIFDTARC